MSNKDVALRLAAAGIFVFPCKGGAAATDDEAKQPVPGMFWRKMSSTDATAIGKWWDKWPLAMPAVDPAKSGFLIIDCDKPKNGVGVDGTDWFGKLAAEHGLDLATVPGSITLSGGRHAFFRQPTGAPLGNARGSLPPKPDCGVDVRGAGGYVLAGGGHLAEGRGYQAVGNLADAPLAPDWLTALLQGKPVAQEPPKAALILAKSTSVSPSEGRVAAYAQAGIEAELSALRNAGKGERNNTLNTVSFKFGRMVASGWIGEGDAAALLEEAAAACGLVNDDGIKGARATIRSGLQSGRRQPRELPAEVRSGPAINGAVVARNLVERDGLTVDAETGEIVETAVAAIAVPAATPAVPGLVGEIADWITATSRRRQPTLALGAALAVVGTAIGRSVAGPTLSATHLYVIGLAPTGAGKDHPLQQCGRLLKSAGMSAHIGPSEFISMPSVINFLKRSPLALCAQDEFGAFLKRVNAKKASSFEGGVLKILRTAWGSSFQTMTTPEWAGRAAEQIMAPALSLFGASTEEEFYGALEGLDRDNGVLNRFLLFSSPVRPPEQDPDADPFNVPQNISDGLNRLYTRGGLLAAALRNALQLDVQPAALAWGADQAKETYEIFRADVEARSDADVIARPFLARAVETAIRIATIIAAGRFSETVDYEDIAIGRDLSLQSAEIMIRGARDHMAETETEASHNRIVRAIKANKGKIGKTQLLRTMRHLKARELDDLIRSMVASEVIAEVKRERSEKGGPPTSFFVLVG